MYKIFFLILFVCVMWLGAVSLKKQAPAKTHQVSMETIPNIGLRQFLQLVHEGNMAIIDMRRVEDYNVSHIKGALSFISNENQMDDRLLKVRNVVIYSDGGVTDQMRRFSESLSKRGIGGITYYSGGFLEWKAANLPMDKNN